MKIRKGDKVKVIAGANRGTIAEVLHVSVKDNLVWVDGVNMRTKHVKPNQANPEGRIETYEAPIHISNVALFDEKSNKLVKVGFKGKGKDKVRINKKTGAEIGKAEKKSLKEIVKNKKNVEQKADASTDDKATKAAKAPVAKKNVAKKAPTQNAKGGSN